MKDLMAKPDDQLTDYERQLKYGEGGDPRKIGPFIDQAFLEVPPEKQWDVVAVFQKAIRIGRGHANPKTLHELVQERITAKMKEQARKTIQAMIDADKLAYSSEAQLWHYVRINVIQTLFDVSCSSVPLNVLGAVADEVIRDCQKANDLRDVMPRRHDEQAKRD